MKQYHRSIRVAERNEITKAIQSDPDVIQTPAELATWPTPPPTTDPIPFIHPPQSDKLGCGEEGCLYVVGSERAMQNHYRSDHGWTNPRGRGGSVQQRAMETQQVPWRSGVQCQRFFSNGPGSRWFEVGFGAPISQDPDEAAVADRLMQTLDQQERRFHLEDKERIKAADSKLDANAWLEHVGWATHLQGFDPEAMQRLVDPVGEQEHELQLIHDSLVRVMDRARTIATPTHVGSHALFEVQRKEVDKKPRRPFDNRVEDDTWTRYTAVWTKLVCYIYRAEKMPDADRPKFRLSKRQGDLMDDLADLVEAHVNDPEAQPLDEDRVDGLTLQVVIALLDHRLTAGEYRSAIISGLAVMGIRKDGGWMDVLDYTPIYSAVIKVARAMVVYQSYQERQAEVMRLKQDKMDEWMVRRRQEGNQTWEEQHARKEAEDEAEEEAEEEATSIFRIVRGKVQRFMTVTPKDPHAEATPMDWIYEARTYGMHIRFNTPAGGTIDWVGDRIKHRRVQFRMGELTEMLHALKREARELLATLTMVDDISQLPRIPWSSMEDDHSEDKVGYSFLDDDRNHTWLAAGKSWNARQIIKTQGRRKSWFDHGREDGKPFQAREVQSYGKTFDEFMEKMFLLMHMVGGQPARSTEILGIRYKNTMNGGVRNIFAHDGLMCFVTSYHKSFRATGQAKVIHRYLPREVGELLVWYLWLVLPWWQQVQGVVKDAGIRSPYLWPDEVVRRDEVSETEQRERRQAEMESQGSQDGIGGGGDDRGDEDGTDEPGSSARFDSWVQERNWTPDRVRRIIQRDSKRLLGTMLNISSWRQIAIAISRRYLDKAFKESTIDGVEEDDDGVDDNPIDLQAGHGTHVAGMVYARELQQGLFSTATMRDKFRSVSRQWHRFLEFREGDSLAVAIRRKREPFETEREYHQLQRFRRLQQVDIAARLREMIGPDAAFRGQQETVIRAIMRGESPIVQIAGTGEGKSMSFMLPAYCSSDDGGTTIVIVPLVALRDDLHGRCAKSQIATYVWNSRGGHQITPIVFVTPESAVTKGFGDFVNRLQARKALDRVVVDECHAILDSTSQFRPQLMELGRVLNEWGVQKVFLTATLPPDEIGRFFEVVGLSASRVKVFRSRTTRPNIGYRVVVVRPAKRRDHHKKQQQQQQNTSQTGGGEVGADQEAEDSRVVKIVQDWLHRNSQGRVIVYANTIDRVERLGRLLECSVFHSKVDTAAGKTQRLRSWIDQGHLIVATNALGLGVDVPDVRLVVHAGMPNRLRDYVQESGRAGRDGNHSEAVVVICQQGEEAGGPRSSVKAGRRRRKAAVSDRAKWPAKEAAVERFISAKWCRRVVLDQVMDGQYDRAGCHPESEVACDVCQRQRDQLALEEDMLWFEREGDIAVEAEARRVQECQETEVEERFRRAQQNSRYEQFRARQDAMQVNEEAKMLEEELALMAGRCMGCFMATGTVEDDQFHPREECPVRGARWWRQGEEESEGVAGGDDDKEAFRHCRNMRALGGSERT
ncbi:hypothetical protein MRS44_000002 [Fusarium solani]|uniref:uncharacterized protein n=1 Tax=Fusarium solani TaxID=169388 RepID=UPI0032C42982|nr:hypothetical protein MRS44_000002 [Fusarium solani]